MKEYIELQHAHVTQITHESKKGEWQVKANGGEDAIYTMDSGYSDKQMFEILRFAREFELKAWNAGIDFMKGQQNQLLVDKANHFESEMHRYKKAFEEAMAANEVLARQIEQ